MAVQSARPGHAPNVIMEPGSRGARGSGMRVQSHPAHARSSGSETLSRSRSLVGYTIDTHESEFSEATGVFNLWADRGCVPRRAFARKISEIQTKSPLIRGREIKTVVPRANFRRIPKTFFEQPCMPSTATVPLQHLPRASRVLPLAKSIAGATARGAASRAS